MSYKIKNGKVVRGDNAFAKHIRETRPQITQAEMLASVGNGGGVFHCVMAHDDDCPTLINGGAASCTCNPDVTYYREKD